MLKEIRKMLVFLVENDLTLVKIVAFFYMHTGLDISFLENHFSDKMPNHLAFEMKTSVMCYVTLFPQ